MITVWFSINCPLVKYTPRVYFLSYLLSDLLFAFETYFYLLLSSDLYYQKAKITSLCFIRIYQSITILSHQHVNFWHRYPKGIDNPFNTSGCKYLFFMCRYHLHSVVWFSYWFDNLGLITKGNTYRWCVASSLPLWGNTDVVKANIKRQRCSSSLIIIASRSNKHMHIISIKIIMCNGKRQPINIYNP